MGSVLIEKLWPNNSITFNKYYSPNEFKKKISKLNPLFEGIVVNDAKDLINFILLNLHEELNLRKQNDKSNNFKNIILDQRNEELMYNNFKNSFDKNNKSIIKDLFYGINCCKIRCNSCACISYDYYIYTFLVFPLEDILKYKIDKCNNSTNSNSYNNWNNNINLNNCNYNFNNNVINNYNINDNINNMNYNFYSNIKYNQNGNNNMNQNIINNNFNDYKLNSNNNNNIININSSKVINNSQYSNNQENDTISLIDCFEYIQRINIMNGENQIYCKFCKRSSDSYFQTILTEIPEILILSINRGNGNKLNPKFQFNEFINLDQFLNNKINNNYILIGVIAQIDENNGNNHFIAYCLDPLNKKNWIKYDDESVTDDIDFQEEIINCAKPYLLFYQKIK